MIFIRPLLLLPICIVFSILVSCELFFISDDFTKMPIVDISVLVRNKEHALPYFLSCLRQLEYPKDRIYLWIYSDYSSDRSEHILEDWIKKHENEYGAVYVTMNSKQTGYEYTDEEETEQWSQSHIDHVIELREKALNFGRKINAHYLLMIDADVYLTNPHTLAILVQKDLDICAPMLQTDGYYSNFWCGMTEKYYYKRTEDYSQILLRSITGCFTVPMVHTCVLMNLKLRNSNSLTYDPKKAKEYDGPSDDVITFAVNVKNIGMDLIICNDVHYGFTQTPPTKDKNYKDVEKQNLLNLKMDSISSGTPLPLDEDLEKYVQYPSPSNYGLDETYVLNLERRPERRRLMELSLKELGLTYKFFKAIDNQELNPDILEHLGIHVMDDYEDPYYKRPIKYGEIGCFLSHYYIWKKVVQKGYDKVLVLEDDIRFVPNFRDEFKKIITDINFLHDWDFVYVGRKILYDDEVVVAPHFVRPRYSYWTLGYIISARGAQKFLDAIPFGKLLPVDEFIPIMFDDHPNTTWKSQFENRNLVAYSASPLLVYPTHYTGQDGYISDTEESTIHTTTTPAPMEVPADGQEELQTIIFNVHSFMGLGENDPLEIEGRFYEPNGSNENWFKSWNYKFYKTEL